MRDEVEGARAVTKLARESTRAASKRAEEAIRETKEKDARIAALERRLKLNSGNNHQPPSKDWPAAFKIPRIKSL